MRLLSLALLSIYLLSSCAENAKPARVRTFDQFDFSYAETFSTAFSLQFTQGDTVYIRQHWASHFDSLKSETTYWGLMPDSTRNQLDSFLHTIRFDQYKESYNEPYADAEAYAFYVAKDSLKKYIHVYAGTVPDQLLDFSRWLIKLKTSVSHYPIDTTLALGSDTAICLHIGFSLIMLTSIQ